VLGHDDASNLLAFTAGEDGGLFGSTEGNNYGGLLNAAQKVEDEQVDEYVPEIEGVGQDDLGETPTGRTRGGGRKRRREGEEPEDGDGMDTVKVKKDSHVSHPGVL